MKSWFLILVTIISSGCSVLGNIDGALALKDYSQERDDLHAYVADLDGRFEKLLRQIDSPDGLKHYQRKENIVQEFGDPVFCVDEADLQKCLWRKAVHADHSRHVYLYFDAQGLLQRQEVL